MTVLGRRSAGSRVAATLLWALAPLAWAGKPKVVAASRAHPGEISDSIPGGPGAHAYPLAISQDGRFVAFVSNSRQLIAGYVSDVASSLNVYLYDTAGGSIALVSHAAGAPHQSGNGSSVAPAISADGRYLAFVSFATDLVAGLTPAAFGYDVYLFDRVAGTTRLASHRPGSPLVAAGRCGPRVLISADGGRVALLSSAVDLVSGQSDGLGSDDVFVYDASADLMRLASHGPAGPAVTLGEDVVLEDLSADGRRVAFASMSPSVVAGQVDANSAYDEFVFDWDSGAVTLASRAAGTVLTAGNGGSSRARLSGDGERVAFVSEATNLVAGQVGGGPDHPQVFLASVAPGWTALASHKAGSATTAGNNVAEEPFIDSTGAAVAYRSYATDMVAGATYTVLGEAYVFDRVLGTNRMVSAVGLAGVSGRPFGLSADGRYVGYSSFGNPGFTDANGLGEDVFVYDRVAATTRLASARAAAPNVTANGESFQAGLSADGSRTVFWSYASDAAAGVVDTNQARDVLSNAAGLTVLVTRRDPSLPGSATATIGGALASNLSDDGRFVLFLSRSSNLIPGYVDLDPSVEDLYLYDRATDAVTLITHAPGQPSVGVGGWGGLISGDGRQVFFSSNSLLLPGGATAPLYALDRVTGALSLLSHRAGAPNAPCAPGGSSPLASSPDGRFVVLSSSCTDLAPGITDTNMGPDLYLCDRQADTCRLVTHVGGSSATASSRPFSAFARLSADGAFLAFRHMGTDLVLGQIDGPTTDDVFLYDRLTNLNRLVSHTTAGPTTAASAGTLSLSRDGAFVAWSSDAGNVVPGQNDPTVAFDVFLYERSTDSNRLVSHAAGSATTGGNQGSSHAQLSSDGRYIAYLSSATNLVAGLNGPDIHSDVFFYDVAADATTLVSHVAGAPLTQASWFSDAPQISADGAFVAFGSQASDLVAGQVTAQCCGNAFRWSSADDTMVLASPKLGTSTTGGLADSDGSLQIAADGSTIAYNGSSPSLVANDLNNAMDAFLYYGAHVKGDLNDDLNTDLVLRSLSQPVHRVWTLDGGANRLAEVDVVPDQTSPDWQLAGVDDFDGDLQGDLVFRNLADGRVEFWMMDGATRVGPPVPLGAPPPALAWDLAATADFDHDAKPDLVWRNHVTQQLQIWPLDGVTPKPGGTIVPSPSAAVHANWIVVAALDLDRDGNTDLLWYNRDSGRIVRWLMNAQVVRTASAFMNPMQAGNSNWKVLAGGDYGPGPNGPPGTADIVWRNETSGRFVLWHMDTGGNRTAGVFTNPMAPDDPLGWTIAGPR